MLVFLVGMAWVILGSFLDHGTLTVACYREFFGRPDYVSMLFRTWTMAGLTTALSLLLAYPTAWVISRMRRRELVLLLVATPWLVSIVVRTYGWIVLLGNRGLVNAALLATGIVERPVRLIYNPVGVTIGLVHVFCPFLVLTILASLLKLDRSLEEAAGSLRAGPWTSFWRVVFPLTVPGAVSGAILVYLMSAGAIVTPLLLGGMSDRMLGSQIYTEVFQLFDFPKAATLAVILGASSVLVVLPLRWIERLATANLPERVA